MADCHPDRKHHAHGLCQRCYSKKYYSDPVIKEHHREYNKKRYSDPAVKEYYREYNKKYKTTDAYKANIKQNRKRYAVSEKGRKWKNAYMREYAFYAKLVRFGISEEEYTALLSKGCGICETMTWCKKGPNMDHDHKCCKKGCEKCFRAILCSYCNKALGFAKDNIDILNNAIAYLNNYKKSRQFP